MRKFLFLIICFFTTLHASAQKNYGFINLDDDNYYEFEVLGDTLDHFSVYFTGENHMYATFNTEFQFKFLKYLYETQGVRHFMFEQSPGVGYIIEEIIVNKKKSHLLYLKDLFYDPFYYLVKNLQKFNDTLAAEDKIHIHGIDIERFPYFSLYALDQLVEDVTVGGDGAEVFEQIHALATSDYEYAGPDEFYGGELDNFNFGFGDVNAWQSLKSILEGAEKYRDSITVALGDDSTIFYSVLKSMEIGREWYLSERKGDIKSPIIRERFMADEFERIYKANPGAKYYGQFGRCHLHKDQDAGRCYDYYMNSIANRINDLDTSLKNKVLVIPIFYSNSSDFDLDVINDLGLTSKFVEPKQNYIIDLAYKNGDQPIVGFYEDLPFVIICNEPKDDFINGTDYWNTTLEEYHLGAYYGYHYFTKINKLNSAIELTGEPGLTNKFVAYSAAFDYMTMGQQGGRFAFTYYPEVNNASSFGLKGFLFSVGSYYPFGNRWVMGQIGIDYAYGRMTLTERTDNTVPNLIQVDDINYTVYTNDVFLLDPNVEFRLTLPFISFNIRGGYGFDVSGKYWKLGSKMKDFSKTSFSSPYIQVGASLNFKMES